MKEVKILGGGCGYTRGTRSAVAYHGEVVSVSDVEAARLVGLGVAAYTESAEETTDVPPAPPSGGGQEPDEPQATHDGKGPAEPAPDGGEADLDDVDAEVKRLERMSKDDLVQMAADLGVDISGARNNHDRAVLIAAADGPDAGEDPPGLGTDDIVQ